MTHSGLLTCTRYAFPPNYLQYCGPLKSTEIQAYLKESVTDEKLSSIISQFETLYPYLRYIAEANNIQNPYDERVVEAYWVGNNLLKTVSQKSLYRHFTENLMLKKCLTQNELEFLIGKIPRGAMAHHTFHVLNIFIRTGHHTVKHTIETMDSCRIGWGTLQSVKKDVARLLTSHLVLLDGVLALDRAKTKTIDIPSWMQVLPSDVGSVYTYHWNTLCDRIRIEQKNALETVTHSAIKLANLTL